MRADRLFGAFVMAMAIVLISAFAACCTTSPRNIETVAGYVDDSSITSTVKSRLAEDTVVDAQAMSVETSNGNVMLSGVARSNVEKSTAESIAIKVRGVKSLQNNIVVKN